MKQHDKPDTHADPTPRRKFLTHGMKLSAVAIGILGGLPLRVAAAAHKEKQGNQDLAILNVALELEHEGIAAYQIGAGSGLLTAPLLEVATLFMHHHEGHRQTLINAIEQLGGKPAAALPLDQYKQSAKLDVKSIKSESDVLLLAQRLELGAINAYLGVMPVFDNRDLSQVAGRLVADETMHYTALTQALGQPLPSKTLSFGS